MSNSAIVVGATGLVGSAIVEELLIDPRFNDIIILHRRKTGFKNSKIKEYIIDFDSPQSYNRLLKANVLFSCLGTTMNKAGSQAAQYKIDYQYQLEMAQNASLAGVKMYVLISSVGANPNSRNFYTKMKGELEEAVKKLSFEKIIILQPSILDGPRKEFRLMERIGIVVTKLVSWIPGIRSYRPIHSNIVAKGAINALERSEMGVNTFKLEEIFDLAQK